MTRIGAEEREQIHTGIRQKYSKVALSPEGNFRYPVGRKGLEALHYDQTILKMLPEEVLASYCGVGNPFSLGALHEGETVLDVGCGAGVDTLVAAVMVGHSGRATGIDLIPEMVERARKNLRQTNLSNVSFQEASAEELPFGDAGFDVVISNGAFNLIPDKAKAVKEVFRVLKSSGRLLMADQVLIGEQPTDTKVMVESWAK